MHKLHRKIKIVIFKTAVKDGTEVCMLEFLPVIIKNAFLKPATRNYPFVVRAPFDKQKGHITIDLPACIFCGMCARKCPTSAIEVARAEKSWSIDRFKCIQCNACVECCPKKCLAMAPQYTAPAGKKSVEHFVIPVEPKVPVGAGQEETQGA